MKHRPVEMYNWQEFLFSINSDMSLINSCEISIEERILMKDSLSMATSDSNVITALHTINDTIVLHGLQQTILANTQKAS